ncbi:type II toxin-antitoxin system VapB family antitoxin [Rhizobium oryzicola]|uniref:Type II toxin-antitoxin system VapB family antitoxin n=1 Tax=Rhizobium oryzicola TaxID=1232668 RepID=A0ABT8SX83_9HYPH|nr:type II toxin-antitoxin system VapB family antitoxin [Rhizobium oryzicola]MDO1582262.1 type II toxin-antitoxin system VapB family antitoxin [Rhizobium oryzicola]
MPLFVRNDEIVALTEELQALLHAPTKTEALRLALRNEIARAKAKVPLRDRLRQARKTADDIGPSNPAFDHKSFSDELWGE